MSDGSRCTARQALGVLVLLAAAVPAQVSGAPPKSGAWRAWLDCPGGELPFALVLVEEGGNWRGYIANVIESIEIPKVTWADGQLVIDIDYYDSRITAKPNDGGTRLDGEWTKTTSGGKTARLPFHAEAGHARRFPPDPAADPSATNHRIDGRWAVKFEKDKAPAVALFEVQDSGAITGTFLTPTGDYRFLAGERDGNRIRLSAFDGAHAFLFDARFQGDGSLKGDFWSRDAHHDTWTAKLDPKATLPDGLRRFAEPKKVALSEVKFPDLDGKVRALDDPAFKGKARIIEVFGSWCPNCHDATKLLVQLDKRYRAKGLSILGVAFELTGDSKRDTTQVKTFLKHHGAEYPVLLAGVSDREKASAALPFLDGLKAYPTTVFLDGDGRVRAIHTGFAGPATGEENQKLRYEFEKLIDELLSDKPASP